MEKKTFTFNDLPKDLDQLKALPEAGLKDPFAVAALAVLAFCRYPESKDDALKMIEFLKGPAGLSAYDQQFIRDRFSDKDYVPRSYFAGAAPENNYAASMPYTLTIADNPYSYQNDGYAVLYLTSGGADSPRQISLRCKKSTGEWFVNEYGGLLMSIRIPAEKDPWA